MELTSSDSEESELSLPDHKKNAEKPKLPAGDRKFVVFFAVRKLEQAGLSPWSGAIAKELGITEQLASEMLRYYWGDIWKDKNRHGAPPKHGYLDREERRREVDGRHRRVFDYRLNQKGNRWLDCRLGFEPMVEEREDQPTESE